MSKRYPISLKLFEAVHTLKNVTTAWGIYNARRPMRLRHEFNMAKAEWILRMMRDDFAGIVGSPRNKRIHEGGKWRDLEIPSFEASIAMIALWRVCGPLIERKIPDQSFSSRKGKGGHLCAKKCERFVHQNADGLARYCLYFDISKFYLHILKRVLMSRIEGIFKDRRIVGMFRVIVYSTPVGLPIGYPFSHALANLYLTPLYYLIMSVKGISKAFVYMDNWNIFSSCKKALHTARKLAAKWLDGVGCALKRDWQLFPTAARGVKICGLVVYAKKPSRLFRGIWHRTLRAFDRYRIRPTEKLFRSLMSRLGWLMSVHQQYNPIFKLEGGYIWPESKSPRPRLPSPFRYRVESSRKAPRQTRTPLPK